MRLEIKGLEFAYNTVPVLSDLSLEVDRGQVVSVVGPNGSGKSTLLKCIDGILKSRPGCILIDGKDLNAISRNSLARRIGYVPQSENRSFPATVFDTVLIGRKPHIEWSAKPHDLKIVSETLKMLDLEELAMRDIRRLSGGQQQKVVVARALAQQPRLLLLDEPTSNLDLKHQLEVMGVIQKQVKQGDISALVSIHDLNLAARYSDRIYMLRQGSIFAAGGAGILTPENIEAVYGVRVNVIHSSGRLVIVPEEPL